MTQISATPVLDVIADLTASSVEHCDLSPDELLLLRLGALAAVDAPPISYLAHARPSVESDVTLEDVQNVLVAVAPTIGRGKVVSAAENIAEALGIAIAVADSQ
jgi:hypothetical protein